MVCYLYVMLKEARNTPDYNSAEYNSESGKCFIASCKLKKTAI